VAVTGTARRSFHLERTELEIPGGGQLTIGMTEDGEIKVSIDVAYGIESFFADGPNSKREGGVALILAPR
jgi:hypothetical protein